MTRLSRLQFLISRPELLQGPPDEIPHALKAAGLYSPLTKESDIALGLPRMLQRAWKALGLRRPAPQMQRPTPCACSHKEWVILKERRPGFGLCVACQEEVGLSELVEVSLQARSRRPPALTGPA